MITKNIDEVKNNKKEKREAIEHGKVQGIPENELGFPTY